MGENYQQIKDFELKLHVHSYQYFNKEITLFEEMMELFLEPLDEVTSKWHRKEEKSALIFILTRMFNDFESSRLLLLNGLPEQAVMPMRDIIECMMLFRLFGADSKFAVRWAEYFKEYHVSHSKAFLDELQIDCPEYGFYGMYSEMVHPSLLSVVAKVTEHELSDGQLVRTYHFGGMNRPTWTTNVFSHLLVMQLMTLLSVLPPVFFNFMEHPDKWWDKVLVIKDKMIKYGAKLHLEEEKEIDVKVQGRVSKKLKIWKIKAELEKLEEKNLTEDEGFPELNS